MSPRELSLYIHEEALLVYHQESKLMNADDVKISLRAKHAVVLHTSFWL